MLMVRRCPSCWSEANPIVLGRLLERAWLRCTACGLPFDIPADSSVPEMPEPVRLDLVAGRYDDQDHDDEL